MKILTAIITLFCAFGLSGNALAQNDLLTEAQKKELDQKRREIYKETLKLTDAEAEKFWPVYDDYLPKIDDLRLREITDKKDIRQNMATMTDAEAEKALDNLLAKQKEISSLELEFKQACQEVLPARKVLLLEQADSRFKRELIKMLRER